MDTRRRATLKASAWYLGAGLALALVFLSYLNPALMQRMANAVWACF